MYTLNIIREMALDHLADMGYSGENLEEMQVDSAISELIWLLKEDGETVEGA